MRVCQWLHAKRLKQELAERVHRQMEFEFAREREERREREESTGGGKL